ncbi:Beta-parvin [Pitangus sulphuratus]|nr:Beta-parvin [Pitangus sulphuratus]
MKKEESFLGKLGGTLARKKKAKEVSDLQEEGKNAINAPMNPNIVDIHPEDTLLDDDGALSLAHQLTVGVVAVFLDCVFGVDLTEVSHFAWTEENEERTMIDPNSKEDPKFKELIKVLIDWINDVLVEERIIVKQLEEDLYDGQVLQKLLEKLADRKLNVAEVTQSEIGQKQKLQTVLEAVHDLLRPHGWTIKWNVDSIHGKNLIAILHLLVALAMHFRAPIRLPEHVSVQVVVVRSLITFVNKHLNKLNLEVTELETQFADGVYLVLLMGLLEDYFVPLHNFYLTPESFDQKVHNVSFAFELMQDGGLKKPKARPEVTVVPSWWSECAPVMSVWLEVPGKLLLLENCSCGEDSDILDVVNLDLKSTLRVLYNLFTKYKNVE